MERKRCNRCGKLKSAPREFHRSNVRPDGLTYWCKACSAERFRQNRRRVKETQVRRKFGISLDQYERLIASGCTACGSTSRIVLDHDHATGRVRAPLCQKCNLTLGQGQDDPVVLLALAAANEERAMALLERVRRLRGLAEFIERGEFVDVEQVPHMPRWSGPPDNELRKLYVDEGLTTVEIAQRYDVTPGGVRARLVAAGVPMRSSRISLNDDEIRRLYVDEGWIMSEIADELGVTAGTVRNRLLAMGVKLRPKSTPSRRGTPQRCAPSDDEVRRLHVDEGLSVNTIASRLGVSRYIGQWVSLNLTAPGRA